MNASHAAELAQGTLQHFGGRCHRQSTHDNGSVSASDGGLVHCINNGNEREKNIFCVDVLCHNPCKASQQGVNGGVIYLVLAIPTRRK